jgi:carbohydrate kinase (thermoresistant glucokinase family)
MSAVPQTLIVMGVAGCGKSLIGSMLAERFGGVFEDADDFHPPSNKAKMSAGTPLTDEDRWPWYAILRARIVEMRSKTKCYVLACSALKRAYRDRLRESDGPDKMVFVYLKGPRELIGERIGARKGHFMPPSLLDSQFAALEEPGEEAIAVDVSGSPEEIVAEALGRMGVE